jgi:hypothetical protein
MNQPRPAFGNRALVAAVIVVAALILFVTIGRGPNTASPPPESASAVPSSIGPTTTAATTASVPASGDISPSPSIQSGSSAVPAEWTKVTPSGAGPSPREGQTWTVDPSSAVAYLFGGRGSADLNDLWVYDLTADSWTRLAPKGAVPGARTDHVAAWIDGLGLVVAGGRSGTKVVDDLWAYDPNANAWRTLATTGSRPPARSGSCSTVSSDGRLWISGGRAANGTYLGDTWSYDPGPSKWQRQAGLGGGPPARDGAACWWTSDGALALYGGRSASATALADLWTLDKADSLGSAWSAHDAAGLPARARAAAGGSQAIVAVGGLGTDGQPRADVTIFDPRSLAATTRGTSGAAGSSPEARSGASLVDDPESERELVFGGRGSSGPSSEVWALTLP